jgi:hypothetical protein
MKRLEVIILVVTAIATLGGGAVAKEYNATPETLRSIISTLKPGDVVTLADGEYVGGFEIAAAGEKGAPIVIKAAGDKAIFRGGKDCVNITGDYVELDGIKAYGADRAGVRVHAYYDSVRRCVCGDNGKWGIFSGFAEGILVEDNECYGSKKEHGIYLSNSTDHAVVRRNHCYNNGRCGIQFNGDPNIPGGDGIMSFNLIEGNVLHDNQNSLNLTCVADSLVRNNLFYHQNTKAIALWDTLAGYEYSAKRNLIINNTVIVDNCTRECIQIRRGATGNVIRNNILVTRFQAIVVEPSCVDGTVIDHNLYFGSIEPERFMWAGEYRSIGDMREAGYCQGDIQGDPLFVDPANADFSLQAGSPAIGAGALDEKSGDVDLAGKPRVTNGKIDIGAYQYQGKQAASGTAGNVQ